MNHVKASVTNWGTCHSLMNSVSTSPQKVIQNSLCQYQLISRNENTVKDMNKHTHDEGFSNHHMGKKCQLPLIPFLSIIPGRMQGIAKLFSVKFPQPKITPRYLTGDEFISTPATFCLIFAKGSRAMVFERFKVNPVQVPTMSIFEIIPASWC